MTYAEWVRVKASIDKRFEERKKEMERKLHLGVLEKDDLPYYQ